MNRRATGPDMAAIWLLSWSMPSSSTLGIRKNRESTTRMSPRGTRKRLRFSGSESIFVMMYRVPSRPGACLT